MLKFLRNSLEDIDDVIVDVATSMKLPNVFYKTLRIRQCYKALHWRRQFIRLCAYPSKLLLNFSNFL